MRLPSSTFCRMIQMERVAQARPEKDTPVARRDNRSPAAGYRRQHRRIDAACARRSMTAFPRPASELFGNSRHERFRDVGVLPYNVQDARSRDRALRPGSKDFFARMAHCARDAGIPRHRRAILTSVIPGTVTFQHRDPVQASCLRRRDKTSNGGFSGYRCLLQRPKSMRQIRTRPQSTAQPD